MLHTSSVITSYSIHYTKLYEFTDKLLKRVKEIKVGDPFDPTTNMGPNVSKASMTRFDDMIRVNLEQGAHLAMGGGRPEGKQFEKGNWFSPTILTNVKNDHATMQQEIFGPILPIMRVSGYEEAVALTNAREEGLSA